MTFRNSFTIALLSILLPVSLAAQPLRIEKVEPPNWWAGMRWDQVQLMVYGQNLAGATAAFDADALPVTAVHSVPNTDYLFVDVDLSRVSPGTYTLHLTRAGETASIPFAIRERSGDSRRNQGFGVDDVVYLITPDRFANGNPANDRVAGLIDDFDPAAPGMRHGGDLAGIVNQLPYLADLGITTLWLNPVLENNAHNSYHGYQTTDHYTIDPRFGTNEAYRQFVEAAHAQGLKVIFDHVNNHIGGNHPWMQRLPTPTWINGTEAEHLSGKHYKMAFSDPYADPHADTMLRTFWFVDAMPDLNQRDPFVASYLIQNSIWWMEYTGLDGYREDTYPYPDQQFLADWAGALLAEYPNTNIVGEIWETAPAYLSLFQQESRLPRDFETNLPAIMDFALADAWRMYLQGNEGLDAIYKVLAQDFLYTDRENIMTLVDNHDMARSIFIAEGNIQKVKQVFTMLLTTRGIPQLLYGSEINMKGGASHVALRADFPGGFPGDTRNAFTRAGRTAEENDMFDFMRQLLHLRKEHAALRRGRLVHYPVVWNQDIYKYLRMLDDEMILVLINGEDRRMQVDLTELLHWFGEKASFEDLITGATHSLSPQHTLPIDPLGFHLLKVANR